MKLKLCSAKFKKIISFRHLKNDQRAVGRKSKFKIKSFTLMVCNLAVNDSFFINKYTLPILIPSLSNCDSKECIYSLFCNKCKVFYIGETGRAINKRIKEHVYKINYLKRIINNKKISDLAKRILFKNFLNKCGESSFIYSHFLFDHDLEEDFKFQVFVNNFTIFRLRLETDLIFIFNTMNPNGLNSMRSYKLASLEQYDKPPLKLNYHNVNLK